MKINSNVKQENSIRIFLLPAILVSLLTALDQLTKYIIISNFQLFESKPIIDGVLSITYIQNKGIAWGLFQGKIPVFLIFTAIILLFSFRIMYNVAGNKRYRLAKYVLITLIAGALGNLIDRISLGYVVDFIYFELIDFPVFNVADIYVCVSMFVAILALLFIYSNEEVDEILNISFKEKSSNNVIIEEDNIESEQDNE